MKYIKDKVYFSIVDEAGNLELAMRADTLSKARRKLKELKEETFYKGLKLQIVKQKVLQVYNE